VRGTFLFLTGHSCSREVCAVVWTSHVVGLMGCNIALYKLFLLSKHSAFSPSVF
jgi:hypothetical protein